MFKRDDIIENVKCEEANAIKFFTYVKLWRISGKIQTKEYILGWIASFE